MPELPDVPGPRGLALQLGDARAERGDVRRPDLQSLRQGQQRPPGLSCGGHSYLTPALHCADLNLALLSAQEFLKLTEFTEKGSIKDKLSWAFKVYDKDMSGKSGRYNCYASVSAIAGTITATEMLEVIGTVITMEGLNEVSALDILHNYYLIIFCTERGSRPCGVYLQSS